MDFDTLVKKRKSIRKFLPNKEVSWKEVVDLVDYANYIPLAGNIPILKFIMADDKNTIVKVSQACQQEFIADASALIIVCSQKKQLINNFDKNGEVFSHQEAGAAINNILLAITQTGLASCWIGHFSDRIIRRTFKIPKDVDIEAIIPIGYEAPLVMGDKKSIPKKPKVEDSLFFGEWDKNKRK